MSTEAVLHNLAISQVILNFAARRGVDQDTCLSGTGISTAMLGDADALIAPEQELRLIENLILALPDVPALGFELGLQYSVATFGTWGFALRTSRHLREAVERAVRYMPLSTAYCVFATRLEGDEYVLSADPGNIPIQLRQFLLERDLGTAINLLRELKLAGEPVLRLELAGAPLPYAEHMQALADIPLHFKRRRNAVIMAAADTLAPLPTFDPHLARLLEDQCRQLMQRRSIGGTAGQVRQQLLGPLGLIATLEEVADALTLSRRSLRRRLDAEGTSFRALVEETRHQLANQLLESTSMKLDEVAAQLGYADTPSFTRAYRRWEGISPGQYRTHATAPQH